MVNWDGSNNVTWFESNAWKRLGSVGEIVNVPDDKLLIGSDEGVAIVTENTDVIVSPWFNWLKDQVTMPLVLPPLWVSVPIGTDTSDKNPK